MNKTYHILNGDALAERLSHVEGEKIVIRECFVDGSVEGDNLEALFVARKKHFLNAYKISNDGYHNKSILEISKIEQIEDGSVVNLWFEFDLFCQVNFWFAMHTINTLNFQLEVNLVTPITDSWMGFGALNKIDLLSCLKKKRKINTMDQGLLADMWLAYQRNDWLSLRNIPKKLELTIDRLPDVVEAHIQRFPNDGSLGRPHQCLLDIITNMKVVSFKEVYKEFFNREGIYGFGDMQVQHLIKELQLPNHDDLFSFN